MACGFDVSLHESNKGDNMQVAIECRWSHDCDRVTAALKRPGQTDPLTGADAFKHSKAMFRTDPSLLQDI